MKLHQASTTEIDSYDCANRSNGGRVLAHSLPTSRAWQTTPISSHTRKRKGSNTTRRASKEPTEKRECNVLGGARWRSEGSVPPSAQGGLPTHGSTHAHTGTYRSVERSNPLLSPATDRTPFQKSAVHPPSHVVWRSLRGRRTQRGSINALRVWTLVALRTCGHMRQMISRKFTGQADPDLHDDWRKMLGR